MADERRISGDHKAIIAGAAAAAAVAGARLFFRRSRQEGEAIHDDAPNWTSDSAEQGEREVVGKTVLVNRPRSELYAAWDNFARFPDFMDNVEAVELLGDDRSRWTIKAPAGKTVDLVTRITERVPDEHIVWQSTPESDIATSGKVSFDDAPGDRGTFVSLVMSYEPPGGTVGKLAAKLFQREPKIQARRDLRRFKQLMETGEVAVNASPSGRPSESPVEARI